MTENYIQYASGYQKDNIDETDIAKAILGCVGSVVEVVMANPLLLIPVGCVMLYTIIRVFKTLF